jgi:hypothetical protein
MFESRILRGLMLAVALALIVAVVPTLALAATHDGEGGPQPQVIAHVTIAGDPLTIHVAVDTSIQVFYAGQSGGQVYPPTQLVADSGAFAWPVLVGVPAVVYGPDFSVSDHPGSRAKTFKPWVPQLQSGPTGSGTAADPWEVVTTVLGPAGVTLYQTVWYVDGRECFEVYYSVTNGSPSDLPITFFHAADLHVDGSDTGYGYHDPTNKSVGSWNPPSDFLEYIAPITRYNLPTADHYQEADYQEIWNRIGTDPNGPGLGFNDSIRTDLHDSGCGLQWSILVPGLDFREVGVDWCFLEVEGPEFVAEPGSVMLLAGGLVGLAGYAGLRLRKR